METENTQNVDQVVKQLKSKGYRLSTVHWRSVATEFVVKTPYGKANVVVPVDMPLFEIRRQGINKNILARGGYTTMRLTHKDKKIEVAGVSKCHPRDSFNNKLAYTKAFWDLVANASDAGIVLE